MRIEELEIQNFKGLKNVCMTNIPNIVVIAGPTGVGKSSILEAIACFKEKTAPYHSWNKPGLVCIDSTIAEIKITFQLFPEDLEYLLGVHKMDNVEAKQTGSIKIAPNGSLIENNVPKPLKILLSLYDRINYPSMGIFEYLNPYRLLKSKELNSLNLSSLTTQEEKIRRITYIDQKFDQTKDYLAQLRFHDLQNLDKKLNEGQEKISKTEVGDSLKPIKDIFNKFLSPKKFFGVDLSSSPIKILIQTPEGKVDIDYLSSGEKEILSVFANLLKLKLKNSIILFDEPDLHLNQEIERKIIDTLKGLGENNQFWIATHSFGIMNSVDFKELYRLEHFRGENQIVRVFDDEEKFSTFKSVAGDAGLITLGEKIVFLEGIEYTDKHILETWFEDQKDKITFVSSGSVSNVLRISDKILKLIQTSTKFNFFFDLTRLRKLFFYYIYDFVKKK